VNLKDLLKDGTRRLEAAGGESPAVDARCLLSHVFNKPREWLIIHDQDIPDSRTADDYYALIERRAAGEPVAYITGYREFWNLKLRCNDSTLIPRPDTEVLVERALCHAGTAPSVLDLGTGTGAIALALKSELPQAAVTGVDLCEQAVELSMQNAADNSLDAEFICGSWYEPVKERKFDLIVSNPPYIAPGDHHLACGDLRFEPCRALVAEEHGLADLKLIISQGREHLSRGGVLLVEHGFDQGESVRQIFELYGYSDIVTTVDYGGNERVTEGVFYGCKDC
jgi:release factor glutamine methyltransferase